MRLVIGMLILSVLGFLSACNVSLSPREETQHLLTTPSLNTSERQSLQHSETFVAGDWPKQAWWESFHSSQLNTLITAALAQNPSLQVVNNRLTAAEQQAVMTRSVLLPFVFFNSKTSYQYLSANGLYRALNPQIPLSAYQITMSLAASYELDFWHKNHNLFYAALGRVAADRAQTEQAALMVSTALAQAYFALKTNLQRKALYEDLYAVRRDILQLQQLLLKRSLSSRLQPLKAAENVQAARQLITGIDAEIAVNKHLINALAGRGPDSPLSINVTLKRLPKRLVVPKHIALDLLARRPDLMAQLWRAKALAYKVGAAKADFYPNINLLGFVGLDSLYYNKLFQWNSVTPGVTPALHLPIFTAGAIAAHVKVRKAKFDEAVSAYNELLLKSVQEVADALVFSQAVYQQKREQDQALQEVESRYRLTHMRKQSGLDSAFSDYYVREECIQQKLRDVTLLYSQYVATIKLIKSLGGGYYDSHIPLRKML